MSVIRKIEEESEFEEVKEPKFESQIPEEILKELTPEMKHLFSETNIQTQAIQWLVTNQVQTNLQMRKTDGRLKRVEGWKAKITSSWSLILAGIVVLSTILNVVMKISETLDKLP